MPCSSSEGQGHDFASPESVERLKRELDDVTAILCEVLKCIPPGRIALMAPETREWIRKHRKFDEEQGR